MRHPLRLAKERVLETLRLQLYAPQIYPDPARTSRLSVRTVALRLEPHNIEVLALNVRCMPRQLRDIVGDREKAP
jgi:hypothetical protein